MVDGRDTWLVRRNVARTRSAVTPFLEPGEEIRSSVPVALGIHPMVLNMPIFVAVIGANLAGLGLGPHLALVLGVAVVCVFLTPLQRLRRLVLTDRRFLTFHVTIWGRPKNLERVDAPAAVRIDPVQPGFPMASTHIAYPDGTQARALIPRLYQGAAERLVGMMSVVIPPMPVPPAP